MGDGLPVGNGRQAFSNRNSFMPTDYMDDESSPSTAEDQSVANDTNRTKEDKSDETEDQLALVQSSFFKEPPKPGMREMVEVVEVYENEVSIKCVYGDDEDKEEAKEEEPESPPEAEDEAYS